MSSLAAATAVLMMLASSPGAKHVDIIQPRVASQGPSSAKSEAVQYAAHGGFLLGNAHRCGIPVERVLRVGELVQSLITASASDERDSSDAGDKFSAFFIATAFPEGKDKTLPISCKTVLGEFRQLEAHKPSGGDTKTAMGVWMPSASSNPSDGE